MKQIPLNTNKKCKNYGNFFAMVDDEDFEIIIAHKWCISTTGKYAIRKDKLGYTILLHREIMKAKKGDGKIVDHVDRNGLNCQKTNLRFCSVIENGYNRETQKKTASGLKGVVLHKSGKWQSQIVANKKRYYLGLFENKEDAKKAYNIKAIELHNEYANIS